MILFVNFFICHGVVFHTFYHVFYTDDLHMCITTKTLEHPTSIHDMEDDFPLHFVRIYPGVNS